jgi:hypothetical protein
MVSCERISHHTVSARSLRDPQKQPPQESLIGIYFRGEGIGNSAPMERISHHRRAADGFASLSARRSEPALAPLGALRRYASRDGHSSVSAWISSPSPSASSVGKTLSSRSGSSKGVGASSLNTGTAPASFSMTLCLWMRSGTSGRRGRECAISMTSNVAPQVGQTGGVRLRSKKALLQLRQRRFTPNSALLTEDPWLEYVPKNREAVLWKETYSISDVFPKTTKRFLGENMLDQWHVPAFGSVQIERALAPAWRSARKRLPS